LIGIKEHPLHKGYFISSEGKVFSYWRRNSRHTFFIDYDNTSPKEMKQRVQRGYYALNIKGSIYFVHKLVAETFLSNHNNYPMVNHIDENKLNNNVNNLEWCSAEQNQQHSFAKDYVIEEVATGCILRVRGFKKFCREHNMSEGMFRRTYYGQRNHHKGYKLLEIIDTRPRSNNLKS
jgi:hypothetical protein